MPTARTFQLDIDTKKYVNRTNVFRKLNGVGPLLPPDIADIDSFVVGLKDLGIWTNTVCWLMGSKYNVGAGTSVLSMGSGTYDGNIIGTVTWSSGGLTNTNNLNYVDVPNAARNFKTEPFSFFISVSTVTLVSYFLGFYPTTATEGGWDMRSNGLAPNNLDVLVRGVNGATNSRVLGGSITLNSFFTAAMTRNDSALTAYLNGASVGTNSGLAARSNLSRTSGSLKFLTRDASNYADTKTMSLVLMFTGIVLSPSLTQSVHTLYKTTAGKALSLP